MNDRSLALTLQADAGAKRYLLLKFLEIRYGARVRNRLRLVQYSTHRYPRSKPVTGNNRLLRVLEAADWNESWHDLSHAERRTGEQCSVYGTVVLVLLV